jgi:hypothetical protein
MVVDVPLGVPAAYTPTGRTSYAEADREVGWTCRRYAGY